MADLKQVLVPDIGDFTDVAVVDVLVAAGDEVAENDPLVTLETDKATMDVPAPFGGVIADVLLKVGDTASQGTPVVTLAVSANAAATVEAGAPSAVRTAVAAEASARPAPPEKQPPPPKEPDGSANGDGPVYASPSVRRLARELGVELAAVSGSGRKGRIGPGDVRAFAAGGGSAAAAAPAPAGAGGSGLDLL